MQLKNCLLCLALLMCVGIFSSQTVSASNRVERPAQVRLPDIEFITAEELKVKLSENQPVTIIDVRPNTSYVDSDLTIKGSIRVKLRRLKGRLAFAPLKNISRDREVVTFCACPSDESSIRAARILLDAGFKHVRALKGGWSMWLKVNGQTAPIPKAT